MKSSSHNISDIVCHSAVGGHIGKIFDEENHHRWDWSTSSVILGNEKESLRVSVQHWWKLWFSGLCALRYVEPVYPRRLKCYPWALTALISNNVKNKVSFQNVFWEIWVKSLVTSSEVFLWHSCRGCQSARHRQVKEYSWLLRSECGFCSHLPPSGCTRVQKKRLPLPLSCFCTTEHQEATLVKNKKKF